MVNRIYPNGEPSDDKLKPNPLPPSPGDLKQAPPDASKSSKVDEIFNAFGVDKDDMIKDLAGMMAAYVLHMSEHTDGFDCNSRIDCVISDKPCRVPAGVIYCTLRTGIKAFGIPDVIKLVPPTDLDVDNLPTNFRDCMEAMGIDPDDLDD